MAKKLDNLTWFTDSASNEITQYLGLDFNTAHRLIRSFVINDEETITFPGTTAAERPFILHLSCANTATHTTFGGVIYGSPESAVAGGALVCVQDAANKIALNTGTHPGFCVTQVAGPLISIYNRMGTAIYVTMDYLYFT
jgi:hypothetical protein